MHEQCRIMRNLVPQTITMKLREMKVHSFLLRMSGEKNKVQKYSEQKICTSNIDTVVLDK